MPPRASTRPGYDASAVELKWRDRWAEARCFEASDDPARPRFFNFDGGPFPNGALHMGHVRTFTLGDVMARYQRMRGCNVLYCFEFDAFGLPNELAAQQRGVSPEELTRGNIRAMRAQMERLGLSYDWRHVHTTCDPAYFRWTQHLFLLLYERGLIYRAQAPLNWCEACGTTLAHMQVEDGRCWRCDGVVVERELTQWFVRLSAYSDVLARTVDELDGWSPQLRKLLAGFLSRNDGVEVDLEIEGHPGKLTAFARDRAQVERASFLLVAARRPGLVGSLPIGDRSGAVADYLAAAPVGRDTRRRGSDGEDATAVMTGLWARHPLDGSRLPVLLSHDVDPGFATGVELGVPDASRRDAVIAARLGIAGAAARSGDSPQIRTAVHYRVYDWLVSRQRTWGTPIPVVHCAACGAVAVPEAELPVKLPAWRPELAASGSLAAAEDFVGAACPRCRAPARRETDTLDCYFDVIWCFLACATRLDERFRFRAEDFAAWMPVSWFHNGVDSFFYAHLYRFIGRVLHEMGILADPEPIARYHGHDAVLAKGRKMSKHHGTAVSPDELIERVGADVLRVHVLWSANPLKKMEWSDTGCEKAERLLGMVWRLVAPRAERIRAHLAASPDPLARPLNRHLARPVQRVTALLDDYRMNGCLEEISLLIARLERAWTSDEPPLEIVATSALTFLRLLAPFAPFMCEELWERIGGPGLIVRAPWPA